MLRAFGNKLATAWDAIQVELHGRYSPDRLQALHDYTASSPSIARIAFVLVATPVPSLLVMVLLDAMPLEEPEPGANGNLVFWARSAAMAAIFSGAYVALLHLILPELSLSLTKAMTVSTIATVGDKLFGYALSLAIGFPVPFSIALESPLWWSLMTLSLAPSILQFVRRQPANRAALRDWVVLNALITSLVFVYPLCNYLFSTVSASSVAAQSALALLLAAVKIAYKNAFNHSLRERKELRAHVVTFHVEIFSTLFVTFSLQNASSYSTLALLMLIDFAHASSTLYEVHRSARALEILEYKIVGSGSTPSDCITRALDILSRRSSKQVWRSTNSHHSPTNQELSEASLRSTAAAVIMKRLRQLAQGRRSPKTTPFDPQMIQTAAVLPPSRPSAVNSHVIGAKTSLKTLSQSMHHGSQALSLATAAAEDAYVAKVLPLLHLTEFAVLTEFVELIVPIVYGMYMMVMTKLPNRVYHAQLVGIEGDKLASNLQKLVIYILLELLSLSLLNWVLRRRVRFSPIAQLAFVLETRWVTVQWELIPWITFVMQTSLYHFGFDYSFQFAWLRPQ